MSYADLEIREIFKETLNSISLTEEKHRKNENLPMAEAYMECFTLVRSAISKYEQKLEIEIDQKIVYSIDTECSFIEEDYLSDLTCQINQQKDMMISDLVSRCESILEEDNGADFIEKNSYAIHSHCEDKVFGLLADIGVNL